MAARGDVREAILDAVDVRLARYGYRKMTVEELAADAGIGKGSIYLHFRSKEEAVLSHIDRIVERLAAGLHEIAVRRERPDARLRQMLIHRVTFRFDSVQHYTESLSDLLAAIRPALLERRAAHFQREGQILAQVLNEGRRTREFDFRGTPDTARALIEATNSLLPYSLSPRELGNRREVERRAGAIADLLVRGLTRRG